MHRDVELLYEIGTLRRVARAWVQFGDAMLANVAEHTMRVMWLALVLAQREGADGAKVVKMALVHDLPETRTGDTNYVTRMYTERNERAALTDSLSGTSVQEDMTPLWQEYVDQDTLEAHIVKDADNLDCDLELVESAQRGLALDRTLAETRQRVLATLHTESARAMFELIYETDPNDWHLQSRNRLTAGDWHVVPAPSGDGR